MNDIKILVNGFAEKIHAPHRLLPTYGYSIDYAHPHIEVDKKGQFHYVIVERGKEFSRHTFTSIDDLLYRIFANVTFSMACDFEIAHRNEAEDCRRQIFSRQEELLTILKKEWGEREAMEHQQILDSYPFDDQA